jgi:hypothetical protein
MNEAGKVDPAAGAAADISCEEAAEPQPWNDDSPFIPVPVTH